jgi:hypothetical protein
VVEKVAAMTMPGTNMALQRRVLPMVLGAGVAVLLGLTLLLWAHYGTAVFLEMIQSGYAACFG